MSKRRSNTSKPPDRTIYLDENLSKNLAPELRRYVEWRVEVHVDHYPPDKIPKGESIPDTEVLKKCGENGWILITRDDKMRLVPDNQEIAEKYATQVFLFPSGNYRGGEYLAALVAGRHKILKFAGRFRGPFWARVCMTGDVYHLDKTRDPRNAPTSTEKTDVKFATPSILKNKNVEPV